MNSIGTSKGPVAQARDIHGYILCEADALGRVDDWFAEIFAPANLDATLDTLAEQAAQLDDPAARARAEAASASPTTAPRSAATTLAWTRAETLP
jgi:hypothetical protein